MRCPKCQFENPEAMDFCGKCGTRLNDRSGATEGRFTPDGERKRVTALFSDLTGYTDMAERLDPEEVKEIMGRILEGVEDVVRKYEGFLEHFAGDGVLVLFGVPKSHEDDPIRAIRAARDIHQLAESMSPRYEGKVGHALSMHSGVNTGLAVTADVDPEKGTHGVTGEAISIAFRLSDLAQARDILVGPDTYRASTREFAFEALSLIRVKGRSEPVSVYKVLLSEDPTPHVREDRQVSSEMIGRDSVLSRLEHLIVKATAGVGTVVNIVGEAGIGKSRLIAELRKREVMRHVTILEGRAISVGRNLSFHPIIELVKQWAGIGEDDSESGALGKLERAVSAVDPDETAEILPFVATLMGMKLTGRHAERAKGIEGEALEKLIVKSIRDLTIRGSELRPTVAIMEDLHWADSSTLELLESLYPLAGSHRIVFVNVFRPGYFDGNGRKVSTVGDGLRNHYVEIQVEPLEKSDSEVLIDNMLEVGGLPYSLKSQIVDRAGGNPFFIEEVVRSLIDEGAVVRKGKSFVVTDRIGGVVIPPTINDVLMARIDRLEEQTREVVKVASVIGRSFFDKIIKEVVDSIQDIDSRLVYLKELQVIRDRIRLEELEYLFKHALTQEAAYESILLRRRREIHVRVADSITKVFSGRLHEFCGMLAFHYSKGDDLEKAEEYLTKAGEEALKASASIEALSYYQEALKLHLSKHGDSAERGKIASLEKNIALALYNRGYHSEAIEYFDRVLDYWGAKRPKSKSMAILVLITDLVSVVLDLYSPLRRTRKDPDERDNEVINLVEKRGLSLAQVDTKRMFIDSIGALRRLNKLDMAKVENGVSTYIEYSGIFSFSGVSLRISKKILDHAVGYIQDGDIKSLFFHTFFELLHDFVFGNWGNQMEYKGDLLERFLRTGEVFQAAAYIIFVVLLRIERGDFAGAEALIGRLQGIGEEYNNDYAKGTKYYINSQLLMKSRKLHEALDEADAGIAFVSKISQDLYALSLLGVKANIQYLLEDLEGMGNSLLQAQERGIHEKQAVPYYVNNALRSQFIYDLHMLENANRNGDRSRVSECKRRAHRSGKTVVQGSAKYAGNKTEVFRLMGVYHWLIGKQGKALRWMSRSIDVGRQHGALLELARTYMEIGKRLLEPGSRTHELGGVKAEGYLLVAGELFREMNLGWDLLELDRVRSRVNQG